MNKTTRNTEHLFLCLFALLLVWLQPGCLFPRYGPELKFSMDDAEEIDRLINTFYENGQFSGAVLSFIADGAHCVG